MEITIQVILSLVTAVATGFVGFIFHRLKKRDDLRAVGYQVKCFQYDGLQAICDDANSWFADYFISIHCNAVENPDAHGTADRRVERKNHFVTVHTDMPAVLVETAFIDNHDDNQLLRERADDFARAIARGISDFYSNQKPLPDVVDLPLSSTKAVGKHFDTSEFACHCCGQGSVDPRLIELLEELRSKANAPVHVNCGYRCTKHNAEVGGVPNSQHVLGTAADIFIPKISFDSARALVQSLPFDGTGFYPPLENGGAWFIHVDVRNGGIGSPIDWWE